MRVGALWCSFVLDPAVTLPHVAFAIGRPVGPAVVRNRLRRRLRALLATAGLPTGWYLIGATPRAATLSSAQLARSVSDLARRVGESERRAGE